MMFKKKEKPQHLHAMIVGLVDNVRVIVGTQEPSTVKANIICDKENSWIDVEDSDGRLTVRTSAIVALWITDEQWL